MTKTRQDTPASMPAMNHPHPDVPPTSTGRGPYNPHPATDKDAALSEAVKRLLLLKALQQQGSASGQPSAAPLPSPYGAVNAPNGALAPTRNY